MNIEDAKELVNLVELALRNGGTPPGIRPMYGHKTAKGMVAKQLGVDPRTVENRLFKGYTLWGLYPNWDLYNREVSSDDAKPVVVEKQTDQDEVNQRFINQSLTIRKLQDELNAAKQKIVSVERMAINSETVRENLFNLTSRPLEPISWNPIPDKKDHKGETLILFISDVHKGEYIDLEQMSGRNSFNKQICTNRIMRLFQNVVKMGTTHWTNTKPPETIYVVLGGDLISGEIHEELAKTNDLLAIPAVKELSSDLISGLQLLIDNFECPIQVISVPGNHGRTTKKPESKGFVVNSYDTLVSWLVESWFSGKGEKQITFTSPASGDAVVSIYGWNFLFTHGDRIGSRGGAGMVGPAATIARGMQRLIQDYATDRIVIDYIMMGHFHTPIELEQGFCNGCLSGPSEYSRSGRMKSHPACQWLISVHPDHGVARRWKIMVGDPSEGSIYKGR